MSLLSHMFSMLHFHYTQNRNSESAAYFRGSYFHAKYTNHWLESLQEKNLILATANGWRYCSFRDKYDSIDDNQSNSNVIFRIIQSCTPFYIFTLVSISFPRNKLWKLYYFYWNLFQWGGDERSEELCRGVPAYRSGSSLRRRTLSTRASQ